MVLVGQGERIRVNFDGVWAPGVVQGRYRGSSDWHRVAFDDGDKRTLELTSTTRGTVSGGGSILAVDFRWCLKSIPLRGAPRGFEGSLYGCSAYYMYCPGRGLRGPEPKWRSLHPYRPPAPSGGARWTSELLVAISVMKRSFFYTARLLKKATSA
jgi:hypothetical protein